jgi:uncharacterized protein with ParB-like and HNH nuclease domain
MSIQALAKSLDSLSLDPGFNENTQLVKEFARLALKTTDIYNEYLPRFKVPSIFQRVNPEPIRFKTFSIFFNRDLGYLEIVETGWTTIPKKALENWMSVKAKFNNRNPLDPNFIKIEAYLERFQDQGNPYKTALGILAHF